MVFAAGFHISWMTDPYEWSWNAWSASYLFMPKFLGGVCLQLFFYSPHSYENIFFDRWKGYVVLSWHLGTIWLVHLKIMDLIYLFLVLQKEYRILFVQTMK